MIYAHGKRGNAREAEHYKPLFPESTVIGFDYKAQAPWEDTEGFPAFLERQKDYEGGYIDSGVIAKFAGCVNGVPAY